MLSTPLSGWAQQRSTNVGMGSEKESSAPKVFDRRAPTDFSASLQPGPDRALVWRGKQRSDIVWVEQVGRQDTFALAPSSISAFRKLLTDAGFNPESVREYLRLSSLKANDDFCLALTSKPQTCINVKMVSRGPTNLELVADDATAQLVPNLTSDELSLVGSSYVYLGASNGSKLRDDSSDAVRSVGLSTRGVVSKADSRFEYDVAALSNSKESEGKSKDSRVRVNTLAAGVPVADGMAFGGVFRAASGGQAFGLGAQTLFAKPAIAGLAWQSGSSDLSSAARSRKVLIQLPAPALVRIFSDGVQLYEGNLPAGSHWVAFTGYADTFVDVVTRDSSGRESNVKAEVQSDDSDNSALVRTDDRRSLWYVDAGKVVNDTSPSGLALKLSSSIQLSASYSYLGDELAYQIGAQSVNGLLRAGASVADRDSRWRSSFLLGEDGERGYRLSFTPRWGGARFGFNFTDYRPPQGNGVVDPSCTSSGLSFCLSDHPLGYRSFGLSLGYRGIPVTFGSQYARGRAGASLLHTVMGAFPLNGVVRGSFLQAAASYAPKNDSKSLSVSFSLPLDSVSSGYAFASTGMSTNFDGKAQLSAGISRSFDNQQEEYLRSVSASVQHSSQTEAAARTAANFQVSSQLGSVANATNIARGGDGNTSLSTTFSANYGASPAGVSFSKELNTVATTSLFSSQSQAGVSVINRSQEEQTVKVQGRETVVPPKSNVLIPLNEGFVQDVKVSPGPVANADDARAGRLLHKGNIKSVTINDGFWVIAKFTDSKASREGASVKPLAVEFTYKRPGEAVERLYASPAGEAILYEFKENGDQIERFISLSGTGLEYRCLANASDAPVQGEMSSYKEMIYRCDALPPGQPPKAQAPSEVPAVKFSDARQTDRVQSAERVLPAAPLSVNAGAPAATELSAQAVANRQPSRTEQVLPGSPSSVSLLDEAFVLRTVRDLAKAINSGRYGDVLSFYSDKALLRQGVQEAISKADRVIVHDIEVRMKDGLAYAKAFETRASGGVFRQFFKSYVMKKYDGKWLIEMQEETLEPQGQKLAVAH